MKMKLNKRGKQAGSQRASSPAARARIPGKPEVNTAHFEFEYPGARCVLIGGSFNNWNPERDKMLRLEDGRWIMDLPLKPGVYEYRFVVDGKWMPDPRAVRNVTNPYGEPNSILEVPGPSGTPTSRPGAR
jgi:1,4-alpha-glucan branching enzyme